MKFLSRLVGRREEAPSITELRREVARNLSLEENKDIEQGLEQKSVGGGWFTRGVALSTFPEVENFNGMPTLNDASIAGLDVVVERSNGDIYYPPTDMYHEVGDIDDAKYFERMSKGTSKLSGAWEVATEAYLVNPKVSRRRQVQANIACVAYHNLQKGALARPIDYELYNQNTQNYQLIQSDRVIE